MSINGNILIYVIAAVFTCVIGIVLALIYIQIKKNSHNVQYNKQLEGLLSEDSESDIVVSNKASDRWNRYWGRIAKESGMLRYAEDSSGAGRDIVVLTIAVAVIVSIIFRNVFAGVIISLGILFACSMLLRTLSNQKVEHINKQLPDFLFALKANIVAGEPLEKAFIKISDVMERPLYDELAIVKRRVLANSTFKEALLDLQERTTSKDLDSLCACMIQASAEGGSLEKQIDTLKEVIEERQQISREIAKGVKSTAPSMWAASLVIPGSFIATYIMDPQVSEFWFKTPLSWAALIVAGILWAVALIGAKRLADGIRNL